MKLPKFIFQAKENLIEKPWGGEWISKIKGFKPTRIGESWEFSAHPSNPSEVLLKDKAVSMIDLMLNAKREILGTLAEKHDRFPILVKILDIADKISIQVHPPNNIARILGEKDPGKDEAWLMLDKGAVYVGFKEFVFPSDIDNNLNLIPKLNKFEVEFLDTFKIYAGVVHFAENTKVLEVSNNSNITYKIYDFFGRKVELEKAKRAIVFKKVDKDEVKGEKGKVKMRDFAIEVFNISGTRDFSIDTFNILFLIDGHAILKSEGEIAELHKGYSCLVPAITKNYRVEGDKVTLAVISPN